MISSAIGILVRIHRYHFRLFCIQCLKCDLYLNNVLSYLEKWKREMETNFLLVSRRCNMQNTPKYLQYSLFLISFLHKYF